jgi:pilus assembly protein Flp/PilA
MWPFLGDDRSGIDRPRRKIVRNQERVMTAMKQLVSKLVKNEEGGEVLEYALIAGLIIVGAIAAVTAVGNRVLARWTSLQNSI